MLKIRISGTRAELEKIAAIMQNAEIKQFRHKSGSTTYAIDSQISVTDFLANNRITTQSDNPAREPDLQEIGRELNDLLDVINK